MAKHSMRGKRWREYRKELLSEAGYRCSKCNRPGRLEIDHITPISEGGRKWARENLQVLCRDCHFLKSGYPMPKHVEERAEWSRYVNELR